ncbi:MAG: DUF4259 domain-containing protein, partial [Chloroflexota bacterium]
AEMCDWVAEESSMHPIYDQAKSINDRRAEDPDTYIEVDDAGMIIGAGEIIALLKGYPSSDITPAFEALADNPALKVDMSKVPAVIAAIEQIYKASELRELWEDSVHADDIVIWEKHVNELLSRLRKIT